MSHITLRGNPVDTLGDLPAVGSKAPPFTLVKTDLTEISLRDLEGKQVLLNIFPSLDTPTCAMSVRHFNESASSLRNTVVLCISADLPFAMSRFCGAEGLQHVIPASVFRSPEFGRDYGVRISTGPLRGLLSRAVVIVDEGGKILYTQQVAEIADEPDYHAALEALKHRGGEAGSPGSSA